MTWIKDPDAVLDYEFDWSQWLGQGETIVTSIWIIAPDGITQTTDSHDGTTATVWLSGGTDGVNYSVTNRITTSGARTDDRTRRLQVRNR